ncbi:hypothetical protein CKO12_12310 [Chromatium okenii]|uniref:BrnA antitoxin family protein n=1 Tax=Chromatium okenii TaxID=61644 RepID=UPI0019083514|nr:BrnA antitoxin family protein [Chromatium okenii]MBK1642644.1 hypothetical protein [Chromatium okenii]
MNVKLTTTPNEWIDSDDAPELTSVFFENATPMIGERIVTFADCAAAAQTIIQRGHPPAKQKKRLLTVRYDADIVEAFQATGPGWQTRMNEALREWLKMQKVFIGDS